MPACLPLHTTDCSAAKDSQLFNTVVRYNMRGAHNSVAKRNFNLFNVLTSPDPDSQDLVAVCDYVLEKLPNPPQELYLIGYSYGATVAASALQQVPQVRNSSRDKGRWLCFQSCTGNAMRLKKKQMLLQGDEQATMLQWATTAGDSTQNACTCNLGPCQHTPVPALHTTTTTNSPAHRWSVTSQSGSP
jgi:hypothetical protein